MTKSTKHGYAVYNFLDVDRDNFTIDAIDGLLSIYNVGIETNTVMAINQTTANELIKVLKEFVNTGDLR